jgi:D-alanyl-D-alanine carboxypeptidase/D-alanyl-D-alanine-endopeptidase (penicillin-binding protein 4)
MPLKKLFPARLASLLLVFALLSAAPAQAAVQTQAAAQTQRERRVAEPRPSATPTPTPARTTPAPADPRPTPTPGALAPAQTPTPAATPTPALAPPPPRTLEELRARIQELARQPVFAASRLAVKVASLDTGRVLYEEDANKWMQPASNLKLYTVAAALDHFGPDYRFVTSVYAPARPDASGTVRGDLVVYGRGDPTYATRFNPGAAGAMGGTAGTAPADRDYYKAIDELAMKIAAAGVRRVEGDLVGDESYFAGGPLAVGWEWDDLQWWYGAEVSALSVNDNSVDLTVKPGARAGDPLVITVGPATPLVTVVDRTKTAPRGTTRELTVHRPLGQNVIEVSGVMPLDDRTFTASVAVSRPALVFATMLRNSLERQGVMVTGRTRTVGTREREASPLQVSSLVELAVRESPPLSVVAAQTMKPSQNLYTELLLRALGKATATDAKKTSEESGIKAVKDFLGRAGIDPETVVMLDGSGLSRANLVTADTTLRLLVHMSRHRYSTAFRDSLPVAGVDGTLRNRMKNTLATGNARAKTGTLGTSTTLSGYVLSAAGERLVFSVMVNNPPRDANPRSGFTDAVAVLLASFAGRS